MFSKTKLLGLFIISTLVGCQQNAPAQKADNASVVNSQPTNTSINAPIIVATCPVAALHGKLKVKGKCLVIEGGANKDIQPIFSENSASWNEATKTLTYLGKEYKEGDEVHWGGGGLSNGTEVRQSPNVSIPICPNTELFSVCP